jgi:hypothetical protein
MRGIDPSPTATARNVLIALAVGLALIAIAIGVVLSRAPLAVIGSNGIPLEKGVAYAKGGSTGCQQVGTVPAGTTAIRISAGVNTGPSVTAKVYSATQLVTHGKRPSGWGINESVTVPVKRVTRTIPNAKICLTFGPSPEEIEINGSQVRTKTASGRTAVAVRLRFEYMRPAHQSWWSLISPLARRLGFGHAPSGTWIVYLLLALTVAIVVLASRLVLRELR